LPKSWSLGPAPVGRRATIDRLNALARRLWQLRPLAYQSLDRGPLRRVLATAATLAARRETDADVEVLYTDGLWVYRVRDRFFPGEDHFVYCHGNQLSALPAYEREVTEDLCFHVYRPKPGDVVVDVGAGIGGETQIFSEAVGPRGRVLSIEANPTTFRRLESRVRLNDLANVTLSSLALVDRSRSVFIEDRHDIYERNSLSLHGRDDVLTVPISGISLDELCAHNGIDQVDYLKLNIEGSESLAIQGMTSIIARVRAVFIACHDFLADKDPKYATRGPVIEFLRSHGFDIVTRDDDSRSFVRDHVHGIRR
jgi:FkbM family methyltransferase